MNFKDDKHGMRGRARVAICASFACVYLLSFLVFVCDGKNLHAAELQAKGVWSAGRLNDWFRSRYSAAGVWDIGGQFRIRPEIKDAGSFPSRDFIHAAGGANNYFLLRTMVHLGWSPSSWFSCYVEGRDAQELSDSRTVPESDDFDLHQAYLRLGDPAKFPVSLKIGRQELSYGDQRYIGNSDWSNYRRSFDALRLRWGKNGFWLDAFVARPVPVKDDGFNRPNGNELFSGVYSGTKRIFRWQESHFYFLAHNVGSGATNQTPRDIYTVGVLLKSIKEKLGPWDYGFEIAGQFGNIQQNDRQLRHRSYAVNATVGHT